jgi:hypothetical protein
MTAWANGEFKHRLRTKQIDAKGSIVLGGPASIERLGVVLFNQAKSNCALSRSVLCVGRSVEGQQGEKARRTKQRRHPKAIARPRP